jgi:hypothetical protein
MRRRAGEHTPCLHRRRNRAQRGARLHDNLIDEVVCHVPPVHCHPLLADAIPLRAWPVSTLVLKCPVPTLSLGSCANANSWTVHTAASRSVAYTLSTFACVKKALIKVLTQPRVLLVVLHHHGPLLGALQTACAAPCRLQPYSKRAHGKLACKGDRTGSRDVCGVGDASAARDCMTTRARARTIKPKTRAIAGGRGANGSCFSSDACAAGVPSRTSARPSTLRRTMPDWESGMLQPLLEDAVWLAARIRFEMAPWTSARCDSVNVHHQGVRQQA